MGNKTNGQKREKRLASLKKRLGVVAGSDVPPPLRKWEAIKDRVSMGLPRAGVSGRPENQWQGLRPPAIGHRERFRQGNGNVVAFGRAKLPVIWDSSSMGPFRGRLVKKGG